MNNDDGYIETAYGDREICPACSEKRMDFYRLIGGPEGNEIVEVCARCGHREIKSLKITTVTWEALVGKTTIFMTDSGIPKKVKISDIPKEGILEFITQGYTDGFDPILGTVGRGKLSFKSYLFNATFRRFLSEKEESL